MFKKICVIILAVAFLLSNVQISNAQTSDKQFEKLKANVSNAVKQYKSETDKLNKLYTQNPSFTIQGDLISSGGSSLYVWGIAVGNDTSQSPGWQINEGNLKIKNPDKNKINYIASIYADSDHYYLGTESALNSFGGKVSVKVYTKTMPKALKAQKDKSLAASKTLQSKGNALEKYISNKYKKLLSGALDLVTLKTYTKELQQIHDFLKQNADNRNLYKLTESFYLKLLQDSPKDIEVMYSLAKFYKDNNNSSKSDQVYTSVAANFPDEFIKRANLKADIWFVTETLSKVGYPNYSVKAMESYILSGKSLLENTVVAEHYVQYLYEAALKENDSAIKKEYLEKAKSTISKYKLTGYKRIMQEDLYEKVCKMLGDIYVAEGNTEKASEIYDEIGTGNFSEDVNSFENDNNILKLADDFAKKGDYKNSYKYFDELVNQYNLYSSQNQNKDMELNSENDYSNLLLGIAYLSHSRFDGEEAEFGLKYLNKAYSINPSNPKTNNALGYLYQHYYMQYPERFSSVEKEALSEKDVTKKIIGYYNKAIKADPNFKKAYGNLNSIYSEDYKSEVRDALEELHSLNADDDLGKYVTFIKNLKDTYFEKSQNSSGICQSGIIEDFTSNN